MTQPGIAPDLAVADALQQPLWTARPDGTVDYANPFWRAYAGFSPEASLGDGWADAVHPDDVAPIGARFRAAAEAGEPYEVEYRFRRADGVYRWHLARVAPIRGPGEAVVGWVGTAIDVDERRRTEEALGRLAAIVEGSQEAIVGRALDGTITSWNPGAERLYGYAAAEILGRDVSALVPPDRTDELAAIRKRLEAGETMPPFETVRVRKDGTRVDVAMTLSPIRDRVGRVVGVSAIARDVGERRRLEEAQRLLVEAGAVLASSLDPEATLRAVADLAVPRLAEWCVVHLGERGALHRVAMAAADPTRAAVAEELQARYPPEPEALHGPAQVVRTGNAELVADVTDEHLAAYARDAEHLRLMRSVAVRSFLTVPLRARGRVLGTVTLMNGEARRRLDPADVEVAQELADRAALAIDNARLYREAQAAETRYRGLFEGVADAILVADADRRYRDANAAAVALLGYIREELLALRVEDVVAAGADWTTAEFAQFRAEGRWHGELELRRKDGTTVPVEARATIVDLPNGPVNISALRDVSERRAAQRQQEEFLEAVSHDLKNPLASIRAQAQLLDRRARRGVVEPEGLARSLASIDAATRRMEAQLAELQDAARLRAGHPLELRTSPADLVALAEEAAADARAASPRHRVRVEAGRDLVVGSWDPLRLRRVLDNLLGNAVKYSPNGGCVTVAVGREDRPDGAWAVLAVRDEGVGIPAGDLPHVFERYHRGSNVGPHTRGAGIGLAGVRQIVEQHGGTVAAESAEGRGSAFTVVLPLGASAPPAPESATDAGAAPPRSTDARAGQDRCGAAPRP